MFLGPPGFTWYFSFTSDFQWWCLVSQVSPAVTHHAVSVESSSLIVHGSFRDVMRTETPK